MVVSNSRFTGAFGLQKAHSTIPTGNKNFREAIGIDIGDHRCAKRRTQFRLPDEAWFPVAFA
jgi:hypothetical protein